MSEDSVAGVAVGALETILQGSFRKTKKLEKCKHNLYGYEECPTCLDDYVQKVLKQIEVIKLK